MSALQRELFGLAQNGELLIEIKEFVGDILSKSTQKALQGLTGKLLIM